MVDNSPTRTAGEGRLVVSVIAGALVFYVCIAIVSYVPDYLGFTPLSNVYLGAWFMGATLSSHFGVEVAKRVAPNFNRIGLIVLMLVPFAFLAIGMFFSPTHLPGRTIGAALSAFLGTGLGLHAVFRDQMNSRPDAK